MINYLNSLFFFIFHTLVSLFVFPGLNLLNVNLGVVVLILSPNWSSLFSIGSNNLLHWLNGSSFPWHIWLSLLKCWYIDHLLLSPIVFLTLVCRSSISRLVLYWHLNLSNQSSNVSFLVWSSFLTNHKALSTMPSFC